MNEASISLSLQPAAEYTTNYCDMFSLPLPGNCIVPDNIASKPSRSEYGSLVIAYDYFNKRLFGGALPPVLITLNHRNQRNRGYYWHNRFGSRTPKSASAIRVPEISLNPGAMQDRSDTEILSTLVHEMVHSWQAAFGSPSRGNYHNRQWAARMEKVGLMPSDTGYPGGRRIGAPMTHYIIKGGEFEANCRELIESGWKLEWHAPTPTIGNATLPRVNDSKTKFTCQQCGQNAWAKPTADLTCGHCGTTMLSGELTMP